jgi:Flp pilus assembly protein TadG
MWGHVMNLHRTGDRGRKRMFGERGAAAVEAAIVTPVVMALLFGIVELGFVFKDYLAVAGAVRSGVRIASANPRTSTFAQVAANTVAQTGGAMNFNDVQQLWVYKVALTSNKPFGFTNFSDCTVCVKFRWDTGTNAFVPTGPTTWSSSTQNACSASGPGGPPDRIGVYLQLKHYALTGLIFSSVNISDVSILTLEPLPLLTGCK